MLYHSYYFLKKCGMYLWSECFCFEGDYQPVQLCISFLFKELIYLEISKKGNYLKNIDITVEKISLQMQWSDRK